MVGQPWSCTRSVWLVRALRSRDARLCQVAIDELSRLHQGKTFGFDPSARSPRREKSVRQWEELLEEEDSKLKTTSPTLGCNDNSLHKLHQLIADR